MPPIVGPAGFSSSKAARFTAATVDRGGAVPGHAVPEAAVPATAQAGGWCCLFEQVCVCLKGVLRGV